MPCNTIQRSKVELLAKSTNVDMLANGLQALGFHVVRQATGLSFYRDGQTGTYDKNSGRLQMPETWDGSAIKRAYSKQVVQSQAVKHGWQISWSTNAAGNEEATVQRRG